jgi:hypothetical protein
MSIHLISGKQIVYTFPSSDEALEECNKLLQAMKKDEIEK